MARELSAMTPTMAALAGRNCSRAAVAPRIPTLANDHQLDATLNSGVVVGGYCQKFEHR